MPKTVEIQVYEYDELDKKAQERARNWYREGGFQYDWWEFGDFIEVAKRLGIEFEKSPQNGVAIHFSGFSSQGDGACFEGVFDWSNKPLKDDGTPYASFENAIKDYAPEDGKLHEIAVSLDRHRVIAGVRHVGMYSHENSTEISITDAETGYEINNSMALVEVKLALREFMRWIYRQLESQWDDLNSDENVAETIRANEYTFLSDGRLFKY